MTATTGSPKMIQDLIHKLRFPSSISLTANKSTFSFIGRSRMRLSSLLPLMSRSNFTLRATSLLSEFIPITLHMGQWFRVAKPIFSSTVSPMQEFLDILTHFWRFCKVWINSFPQLPQISLLGCWILLHLLPQCKSGFWKTPGGGLTIFVFIVNILFGDISIVLCP